jgi:hypothetical protein
MSFKRPLIGLLCFAVILTGFTAFTAVSAREQQPWDNVQPPKVEDSLNGVLNEGNWIKGVENPPRSSYYDIEVPETYKGLTRQEAKTQFYQNFPDEFYYFEWESDGVASADGQWYVYFSHRADLTSSDPSMILLNTATNEEEAIVQLSDYAEVVGFADEVHVVIRTYEGYGLVDITKRGADALEFAKDYFDYIEMIGSTHIIDRIFSFERDGWRVVQWEDPFSSASMQTLVSFDDPYKFSVSEMAVDADAGLAAFLLEDDQLNVVLVVDLQTQAYALVKVPVEIFYGVTKIGFTAVHEVYLYGSYGEDTTVWKFDPAAADLRYEDNIANLNNVNFDYVAASEAEYGYLYDPYYDWEYDEDVYDPYAPYREDATLDLNKLDGMTVGRGNWRSGTDAERTGLVNIPVPRTYNDLTEAEAKAIALENFAEDAAYTFTWGSQGYVSPDGTQAVYLTSKADLTSPSKTIMLLDLVARQEAPLAAAKTANPRIIGWIDDTRIAVYDDGDYGVIDLSPEAAVPLTLFAEPRILAVDDGQLVVTETVTGLRQNLATMQNTATDADASFDYTQAYVLPWGFNATRTVLDAEAGLTTFYGTVIIDGVLASVVFTFDLPSQQVSLLEVPPRGEVIELGFTAAHELYVQYRVVSGTASHTEVLKIATGSMRFKSVD